MKSQLDILRFVPTTWEWDHGARVVHWRCSYSVHDHPRSLTFHQCRLNGTITVGGTLWCERHAKAARLVLNRKKARKA